MGYNCPHCSVEITGVTTEEGVKKRLAEQKAAHTTALAEVAQRAEQAAAKAAAAEADLGRLRPLAERAESLDRDLAYQRAGIPEAASKAVETLYRGYRAEAGDAAIDRAAWLADAAAQGDYAAMVAAVRVAPAGAPATPPAAAPPAAKPPGASTLPPASANATANPPAAVAPKMSADQFREQTAKLAEAVRAAQTPEARTKARADYDTQRAALVAQMAAPTVAVTT